MGVDLRADRYPYDDGTAALHRVQIDHLVVAQNAEIAVEQMLVRQQPKLLVRGRHQPVFAPHGAAEQHRAVTELVSARLQHLLDESGLRQRVGETLNDRRAQLQLTRNLANSHRLRRAIQEIEYRQAPVERLIAAHCCTYYRNTVPVSILSIFAGALSIRNRIPLRGDAATRLIRTRHFRCSASQS